MLNYAVVQYNYVAICALKIAIVVRAYLRTDRTKAHANNNFVHMMGELTRIDMVGWG
jgi:hypothetical protein